MNPASPDGIGIYRSIYSKEYASFVRMVLAPDSGAGCAVIAIRLDSRWLDQITRACLPECGMNLGP